jgi:hypothetical protein
LPVRARAHFLRREWRLANLSTSGYREGRQLHRARRAQNTLPIHTNQHLPGGKGSNRTPLHVFALLSAIGLVATTLLGVVMAFRVSRGIMAPLLCLIGGVALPALILLVYR